MYGLTLVAGPTVEPVSLVEAKAQCRIDDASEDGLIAGYILAARSHIESTCGLALADQTWEMSLSCVPRDASCGVALPRAPVQSIASIKYYDTAGVLQTWAPSSYYLDITRKPSRVFAAVDQAWPTLQRVANALTIQFVAGYSAAAIEEPIRQALLLLIAHFHENREPVNVGNIVTKIPLSVEALLEPYRLSWFA